MGKTINIRTLTASELLRLPSPVFICSNKNIFYKTITESGYSVTSLNISLAKKLAGLPEQEVQRTAPAVAQDLLTVSPKVYLKDYEILFDPRYKLDVLRMFADVSRRIKLIVKWCGRIEGDSLVYAEQGFADYKRYNINDYEITVIK